MVTWTLPVVADGGGGDGGGGGRDRGDVGGGAAVVVVVAAVVSPASDSGVRRFLSRTLTLSRSVTLPRDQWPLIARRPTSRPPPQREQSTAPNVHYSHSQPHVRRRRHIPRRRPLPVADRPPTHPYHGRYHGVITIIIIVVTLTLGD